MRAIGRSQSFLLILPSVALFSSSPEVSTTFLQFVIKKAMRREVSRFHWCRGVLETLSQASLKWAN